MSVSLDTPEDIANWLRRHFVGQTFGCVRFWQFALVRPNDQFFQLASVTLAGDRLDLQLQKLLPQRFHPVMSLLRKRIQL
jgi:hypothetical protein